MLAINYPEVIIEEPTIEQPNPDDQSWPPHPGTTPGCPDPLHCERPANQAAFHEWAQAMYLRVFRLEKRPEGPMITVDTPTVKGLTVTERNVEKPGTTELGLNDPAFSSAG